MGAIVVNAVSNRPSRWAEERCVQVAKWPLCLCSFSFRFRLGLEIDYCAESTKVKVKGHIKRC